MYHCLAGIAHCHSLFQRKKLVDLMDKYIVALLNNNLRVIIPDFGAFIIKQNKPKIVVFNESLKHDDGLLIDFMMKTEGVEKEIAMQQLSDFLANAAKVIEARDILTIEGWDLCVKIITAEFYSLPKKDRITLIFLRVSWKNLSFRLKKSRPIKIQNQTYNTFSFRES